MNMLKYITIIPKCMTESPREGRRERANYAEGHRLIPMTSSIVSPARTPGSVQAVWPKYSIFSKRQHIEGPARQRIILSCAIPASGLSAAGREGPRETLACLSAERDQMEW